MRSIESGRRARSAGKAVALPTRQQPGAARPGNRRMRIDIGIGKADRKAIAGGLAKLLADSYTLCLKTHIYHWNVTGPMSQALHLLFGTQRAELALAVDLIAERIRALGEFAPASYAAFARLTVIAEAAAHPDAQGMVCDLVLGQEAVVKTARSLVAPADAADDEPTLDLLTRRMRTHEKNAWKLRSLLG
jgi:starvation-inducible DNA-binding protein